MSPNHGTLLALTSVSLFLYIIYNALLESFWWLLAFIANVQALSKEDCSRNHGIRVPLYLPLWVAISNQENNYLR